MQLNNLIKMNDWPIGRFLRVVFVIQVALISAIVLDSIGLEIPIIRELIGFIYLSYIPGIVILRILKLHNLGNLKTLSYSVGISTSFSMFTGFFINTIFPLFGISKPITIPYLIITIGTLVVFLSVLSYLIDKNYFNTHISEFKKVHYSQILFLCEIPFLAVFGTYLLNFRNNNIILILLIFIVALVVFLVCFDKISSELYPLAIFMISLSLLYHTSLISLNIIGGDIQIESGLANLVIQNSYWNSTILRATDQLNTNSMLSVIMLAPIYSIVCKISITWVFKVIYPLFFSLVPLTLYQIFKVQTSEKVAFFSCFFFISLFTFYGEIVSLARQQIAEMFFSLLVLVLLDDEIDKFKKNFLFILFGFSLIVSHYGLTYMSIALFISSYLILNFNNLKDSVIPKIFSSFKFKNYSKVYFANKPLLNAKHKAINLNYILLYIIFSFSWYIYISNSSPFNSLALMFKEILVTISSDLADPGSRGQTVLMGIGMSSAKTLSLERQIHIILQYLTQVFIILGFVRLLRRYKETSYRKEYLAITSGCMLFLMASIVLPHFSNHLNITRIYSILLLIVAPLCIIGGEAVFRSIHKMLVQILPPFRTTDEINYLKILGVFILIPYFLFNVQIVYLATDDVPTTYTGLTSQHYLYMIPQEKDIAAANWLSANIFTNSYIYTSHYFNMLLYTRNFFPQKQIRYIQVESKQPNDTYVYVNYGSIIQDQLLTSVHNKLEMKNLHNATFTNYSHLIYNNGAEVFKD